jgi:IS4 transposase
LTNLLHFGLTTIAVIYKDRWEIELFFKALKQNQLSSRLSMVAATG